MRRLGVLFFLIGALLMPSDLFAAERVKKVEPAVQPLMTRQEVRKFLAGHAYMVWVLTTESRIPKRYIVRFNASGQLTTAQPLSIYFNNNRLQLIDADLIVGRRP